jgi:uncharacterized glyoxalase superfamily protein PhnB
MTSTPGGPAIVAGAYYADAGAAVAWLVKALGFRVAASFEGPDGTIVFAELAWGNGIIFVSRQPDSGPWARVGKTCICLVVEDAAAVETYHRRAVDAGAKILRPLHVSTSPAFPNGATGFDVEDPEGNLWTVSDYQPCK